MKVGCMTVKTGRKVIKLAIVQKWAQAFELQSLTLKIRAKLGAGFLTKAVHHSGPEIGPRLIANRPERQILLAFPPTKELLSISIQS